MTETPDWTFSKPATMVLWAVSVSSLGAGNPDCIGADMEEVRDLLVMRFGMTTQAADGAIAMAYREGAIVNGDPQL